ncbi:hypothetical protein ACHAP5_001394 [Fusarium lateritium]
MVPRRTNPDPEEDELGSYPMSDISPEQLDQLTDLLWMDPGVNVTLPNHEWLLDQQARIAKLDKSNRRSKKIRDRLSARLESLTLQHVDDGMPSACLCPFHHDLDRKLIRRLMLLIAAECTQRIQILRTWRQRIDFPASVTVWLDRIDAVSGLWFGRDAFNATFGYERASPLNLMVRSKCEACIMSVIGGRPQVLSDLRANLILRRDRRIDRGSRGPRLLRLVESWVGQFDVDCRKAIVTGSGVMSEELDKLLSVIKSMKEERPQSNKLSGTSSRTDDRHRSRAHEDDDGRGRGYQERRSHRHRSQQGYEPENNHENRQSGLSRDDDEAWMDEDEDCQTSIWMDCLMQKQGLSAEQRRRIFEQDIHPALSDYAHSALGNSKDNRQERNFGSKGKSDRTSTLSRQSTLSERHADGSSTFSNPSAVPSPLSFNRQLPQLPNPPQSTAGGSDAGTIWEPVLVISPPASVVEGPARRRGPIVPNRHDEEGLTAITFADNRAHLEFCERWGLPTTVKSDGQGLLIPRPPQALTQGTADNVSVAAASSVYSSHPGFRRSQENLTAMEEREWSGRRNRASSSRLSRVSTQNQPDRGFWNQLRSDREKLLDDEDE